LLLVVQLSCVCIIFYFTMAINTWLELLTRVMSLFCFLISIFIWFVVVYGLKAAKYIYFFSMFQHDQLDFIFSPFVVINFFFIYSDFGSV
jgi:hypothetical protein